MPRKSPYPRELRDRAVRMVAEIRPNYETEYAAITAVAAELGIGTAETLRKWVRRARDRCRWPALGVLTARSLRSSRLRAEVRELQPANETSHARWGQAAACSVGAVVGGKAMFSS